MANYKIAYCGGVMSCDGYVPPSGVNVSSLFINGELNTSATNPTDADAFIFASGDSGVKLHIFKSCCSPRMKCTYNSSGKIIMDNRYVWAEKISYNGGGEEFIMTDYGKYGNSNGNNTNRIDTTVRDASTVEFWFTNVDSNQQYTASVGDIPSATTEGMFRGISNLVSCEVPAQMRNINDYTFEGCTSLTSYTKNPDFIDRIGVSAFENCQSLEEIVIGHFTTLSEHSFTNCSSARVINWNNFENGERRCKMDKIPNFAFYNCQNLSASTFSGGTVDAIVIPKAISGIGASAFANCDKIKNLKLNDVETIGNSAFYDCDGLKNIEDFSNVTSVGDYAFYRVGNNNEVVGFGNLSGLTFIGEHAFEDVAFGDHSGITLTKIANLSNNAFCDTKITGITKISANTIGENTFASSEINGNVNINTNTIGKNAFYNATISGNTNISAYTIENNAFKDVTFGKANIIFYSIWGVTLKGETFGGSNISSVTFNTDVKLIDEEGYGSFENCSELKSVTFNGDIISATRYSFNNCPSLRSITFGSEVADVSNAGGCFYRLDENCVIELHSNGVVDNLDAAFDPTIGFTFKVPREQMNNYEGRYSGISSQWGWQPI